MYVPGSDDVLAIRDYPESELEKITFKSTNDQEEDKDDLPYGHLDCISHGSLYEAVLDKYSISNMTNYELLQRS